MKLILLILMSLALTPSAYAEPPQAKKIIPHRKNIQHLKSKKHHHPLKRHLRNTHPSTVNPNTPNSAVLMPSISPQEDVTLIDPPTVIQPHPKRIVTPPPHPVDSPTRPTILEIN